MRTECGIFAAIAHQIPAEFVLTGMRNIQHRGQDSFGVISINPGIGGTVSEIKEFGLLPNNLMDFLDLEPSITLLCESASNSPGVELILGHTRYSTVAATIDKEAIQPIELSDINTTSSPVYIAFNGNLPNLSENMLRALSITELEGSSDTFLFRAIWQRLATLNPNPDDLVVEFARYCITRIPGAYSCVVAVGGNKLVGFRDRYGYKPLWYYRQTRTGDGFGISGFVSETVQLSAAQHQLQANYELVEVPPGSYIILDSASIDAGNGDDRKPIINRVISLPGFGLSRCSMEVIYFMQDNSLIRYEPGNINLAPQEPLKVRDLKYRLGQQLGLEEDELECLSGAQIIYVPESSYNYAVGYSETTGQEFVPGAIKKIYNIRSFIESNTEARVGKIKRKFEFAFGLITSPDVILIDDSLVRGNTMKYIITQIKQERPELRVHIRIASPIIKDRCWFGIDIAEQDELLWWQTGANLSELQKYLGVASIQYLSLEGLMSVLGPGYCQYCFGSESDANRRSLEW